MIRSSNPITAIQLLPFRGGDSRNHDSSGSTSADDFEKYTDSSHQQFTTRRLMPLLIARSHRSQENNRTRPSSSGQRRGRSNRLSDATSARNDPAAPERAATRDTNRSAQTPSINAQASGSSMRVLRLGSTGGRNGHNEIATASSTSVQPASTQIRASESGAAPAAAPDGVAVTSTVIPNTEISGGQFTVDTSETLRVLNRKILESVVDAEVAGSGASETTVGTIEEGAAQPSIPGTQDSTQKIPQHKSVSGDPIVKQLGSVDKEAEPLTATIIDS
ncbi:unnamed protein product [Echinostoma caproni]|uniref:Uncharacterized protein n=1 Tax=Echinostoma caproni TaxID=27848 RepID=A0A183AQI8_9TREM|nr:unnamed protein product [Echinostoma caproni]